MIFFQNLVESLKLRRPPRPRSSLLRLVKEFHEGWFVGEVTDIFVSGGMKKIRRCTYSDGDAEDLRRDSSRAESERATGIRGSSSFSYSHFSLSHFWD